MGVLIMLRVDRYYNPDWAIVKDDDQTLNMVRETKSKATQQPIPE